jgi:hypothetical protein
MFFSALSTYLDSVWHRVESLATDVAFSAKDKGGKVFAKFLDLILIFLYFCSSMPSQSCCVSRDKLRRTLGSANSCCYAIIIIVSLHYYQV